jgi:hypothetical protein
MIAVKRISFDDCSVPSNPAIEMLMENFREELQQVEDLMYVSRFDLAVKRAEKIVMVVRAMGELVSR